MRTSSSRFFANSLLAIFLMAGAVSSGCTRPTRIQGRLAFADSSGCGSAVASQNVTWEQCHAFKQHFARSTGSPITTNAPDSGALRPLAAQVELTLIQGESVGELGLRFIECGKIKVQTDYQGVFNTVVQGCPHSDRPVLVLGTAILSHQMHPTSSLGGTVRAVWREELATEFLSHFSGVQATQVPAFTTNAPESLRFATPAFEFIARVDRQPVATRESPGLINVGTRVLLDGESGTDSYGYLRQVLAAYQNTVTLHHRMRDELGESPEFYERLYPQMERLAGAERWGRTYSVFFDNTWAAASCGYMNLYRPDYGLFSADANRDGRPDGAAGISWLLSDTAVIGHEFGHSAQCAFAPIRSGFDYDFAGKMTKPNGDVYDWGHGGWQNQEMGVTLFEGSANTIGQYLINRCGSWGGVARPTGGMDPYSDNIFSTSTACDATVDACGFHHTRWHLSTRRGVAERTTDWNARIARVAGLEAVARTAGHRWVLSNQELRMGEMGCDLLDAIPGGSHLPVADLTTQAYVPNYTYWVTRYLDGATTTPPAARRYSASSSSENVTVSFRQYLDALGSFCPTCSGTSADFVFGETYSDQRVSTQSELSPQGLLRRLITMRVIDRSSANSVLRSNLMEELE